MSACSAVSIENGTVGLDLEASRRAEAAGERIATPRPAHVAPADWERFERHVAEIFAAFGMDLDTPGTRETPARFLRALYDATAGYDGDEKLLTAFPSEAHELAALAGQIVEGPIAFVCLCEHHALPFHGVAHVGYIAGEQIIGISKLTRLVRLFARRFTVQERLGEQIADALVELIEPRGVAVHLDRLAPLHADARRRGALAHGHDVLARRLRGSGSCGASSCQEVRRTGLELLYEADGPACELPDGLAARYPGRFGFDGPRVVANFVSTLDGVVAIPGLARANRLIADENDDDRFVMGLLRAAADVGPDRLGDAAGLADRALDAESSTYPDRPTTGPSSAGGSGARRSPALAVITGSGRRRPDASGVRARRARPDDRRRRAGALGPAARRRRRSSRSATARSSTSAGRSTSCASAATSWSSLEAGPHVVGSMLGERLVDELFLTVSPLVAGRAEGQTRLGFVAGRELLPDVRVAGDLVGVRRSGDHLFLHYALGARWRRRAAT